MKECIHLSSAGTIMDKSPEDTKIISAVVCVLEVTFAKNSVVVEKS